MESVFIRAHSLSDSQTSKHTGCPKNVLVFDKQQNIGLLSFLLCLLEQKLT